MKRLLSVTVMAAGLWLAGGSVASAEVDYPWCIVTGGASEGAYSCGYVSFAQCQATRLGTDMCVVNPLYQPPAARQSQPRPRDRDRPRH